jgi:hypothetical protein
MSVLAINAIRLDGGTQPRASIHQDWIKEYAEDMLGGAKFPQVVVFFDGTDYWLADGFHRTAAAEAFGATDIDADVRQGTQRDAILFSVSANSAHGQRRSNEDKRRAVLRLLNDQEWSVWSDREIARRCGVDHMVVVRLRPPAAPSGAKRQIEPPRIVQRGGSVYQQNTAGINANRRRPQPQQTNDALPLPEQTADLFTCESCDEQFPTEVWHCGTCDHHWPLDRDTCWNCHKAPDQIPKPAPRFDHEAASIRNSAMEAIRALSEQPSPEVVLDAWMKHAGYGEPVEMIEKALGWIVEFLPLYRDAEPRRWAERQEKLRNVA